MDEKRQVFLQGKLVPGTAVKIMRVESEPWTEVLLSDGTLLRLKITMYEVTRVDDMFENDGTPIYLAKWGVLQHTMAPDSNKKLPTPE